MFKAYLYLSSDASVLYVDEDKVDEEVRTHLSNSNIKLRPYNAVFEDAHEFHLQTLINKNETNTRLFSLLKGSVLSDCHPVETLKSVKDEREMQGFRECHVRDGVALCRFLAWL